MIETTVREMEEREEPKFMTFDAQGDFVSGVLTAIQNVQLSGKPAVRYVLFNEEENQAYAFNGTAQLNSKFRRTDIGKYAEVTFTGLDNTVVKNGNAMKTFKVKVAKAVAPNVHGVAITDSDIPF